jgi:hypothetical protein
MQRMIPSPEEIAARMMAREAGVDLADPGSVGELQRKVEALDRRVRRARSAKELREALDVLFEKYDFNPARELIEIVAGLRDAELTCRDQQGNLLVTRATELRVRILQDLLGYATPKLKSVEVTGAIEHNHNISVVRYGEDGSVRKERTRAIPVQSERMGNG